MQQTAIEKHVEAAAKSAGDLLRSRYGLWALASISFVESALIVPIITDPFLVVYILAKKKTVIRTIFVTTISSVLGGIFAYVLAMSFYEFIAEQYLVGTAGEQFYTMLTQFQGSIFILTLLGALTPVPYTIVALGAGFAEGSFWAFVAASLIGRGVRYTIVGGLTYRFGEKALTIARKRIMFATIVCIAVAAVYLALH